MKIANSSPGGIFGIAAGGGLQNESHHTLAADLGADRRAGAGWIRVDIDWAEIQRFGPRHSDWRGTDALVRHAMRCHMRVLGALIYSPNWTHPGISDPTYAPPPRPFGAFAGLAARHLAALGVHAYEIWNEPNSVTFWKPRPNPGAYTALLKAADVRIKRSDPGATVVTGGTSPAPDDGVNIAPIRFLSALYAHGAQGYFDAVGHHPYCWPAFPGKRYSWSAWYQMYGTRPSLRSLMIAHGDRAKRIWATEYGAPTYGPPGSYVSQRQQAVMLMRAYGLFARYSWAGPLFFFQGRDEGNDYGTRENFFGVLAHNFRPKLSFRAYQLASARF